MKIYTIPFLSSPPYGAAIAISVGKKEEKEGKEMERSKKREKGKEEEGRRKGEGWREGSLSPYYLCEDLNIYAPIYQKINIDSKFSITLFIQFNNLIQGNSSETIWK